MSTLQRQKTGDSTVGGALTITYTSGTAPDATHGHVLFLRSYVGSTLDPTPATPAGWTLVDSAVSQSGAYTVRLDIFRKRGDSTTNSVTVAGATSVVRNGWLVDVDGVDTDVFTHDYTEQQSASNFTSRSITVPAATASDVVYLAGLATSGTFGAATGATWSQGTQGYPGTSSSSSFSTRYVNVGAAAAQTFGTSWTTSTLAATNGIWVGGAVPVPLAPTGTVATTTGVEMVDLRGFVSNNPGGTLSYAVTGVTVVEQIGGLFLVQQTGAVQYATWTVTDSTVGAPTASGVRTIPALPVASTGLEWLTMDGGALV